MCRCSVNRALGAAVLDIAPVASTEAIRSVQNGVGSLWQDTYTVLNNTYMGAVMKTKLTVTLDTDLIPRAKQYARNRGLSLSQVIENELRKLCSERDESFSKRWRGKFQAVTRDEERYQHLARKYLC